MKELMNTFILFLATLTLTSTSLFANEYARKGQETANIVVVKGKVIATLDKDFIMTYKGQVYICHVRERNSVQCHLNNKF